MLTTDQINQHVWRKDQYIRQHEIGPYQIVEYWFGPADNSSDRRPWRAFAGFIDGKKVSSAYSSLDACLVGLISVKHDGINTRADTYFMKGIGAEGGPEYFQMTLKEVR